LFKPGTSGNPRGRPPKAKGRVVSTKRLKESLKNGCVEAFAMTMEYLREYKGDAKASKKEASAILEQLLIEDDPIMKEELTNKLRSVILDKDKAMDKALKASFKIQDSAYTMILQEERLSMSKDSSDEDEEADDSPAPVLQLTAVKTK